MSSGRGQSLSASASIQRLWSGPCMRVTDILMMASVGIANPSSRLSSVPEIRKRFLMYLSGANSSKGWRSLPGKRPRWPPGRAGSCLWRCFCWTARACLREIGRACKSRRPRCTRFTTAMDIRTQCSIARLQVHPRIKPTTTNLIGKASRPATSSSFAAPTCLALDFLLPSRTRSSSCKRHP